MDIEEMTATEYIISLISALMEKCKTLEEFKETYYKAIGKK